MGFSSRLQRFAQAKVGVKTDDERPPEEARSATAREEVDDARGREAEGDPQARLLEDLRARMTKALAKHDRKRERERPPPDEEASTAYREPLPLEHVELASGSFDRRLRVESPLARVGGVPLADACDASFPWLGVLALDETIAGCSLEGALFLDTETTGLAGGTGTVAFLVGLAWWSTEEERFVTELLFLPTFASEAAMLEHLEARLRAAKCLVTFNGKSFDVPLLKTRFALHRRAFPFEGPHLDLLHVARRLHRGRDFGVRLQALEQALFGLERVDDIPSAQVAQAYLAWLRGGDSTPVRAVLEHNVQDVLTMVGLVALYGRPPAESRLQGKELVAAARTATKAKALAHAKEVLEAAEGRGLDSGFAREFHLAKAALCKHEAAWSSAASSLEEARAWLDDDSVRLDLAKLYEHRLRDARAALELTARGTGEGAERTEKRKRRLERKASGKAQTKLPGID
jgi:uncharacterized protein YprB with RNaseH-like and TPR domain